MDQSYHIQHRGPQHTAGENEDAQRGLTRRQSLKWMGVLSAGLSLPLISGCEGMLVSAAKLAGSWPELNLKPITGEGYGTDPNLINPPVNPWPLTLTDGQRQIVKILADILIPRDGVYPAASEVDVVDVVDEWVSAPYESFQADRVEILSGLVWLDEESVRRFGSRFVESSAQQKIQIIDDIAYEKAESELRFAYIARVFDGLRTLIVISYFSSEKGIEDIGYQGNIPIAGDYPGPSSEALEHLQGVLKDLGLSDFSYS